MLARVCPTGMVFTPSVKGIMIEMLPQKTFGGRVSTHFYNMPEEVDRLLASVRYVAENTSYVSSG